MNSILLKDIAQQRQLEALDQAEQHRLVRIARQDQRNSGSARRLVGSFLAAAGEWIRGGCDLHGPAETDESLGELRMAR